LRHPGRHPFMGGFPRRGPAGARILETVERLALTPQHSLHLVRVGGREVVVATHPQGSTLLIECPAHGMNQGMNQGTGS